ncbi:hypothetical protein Q1695_015348 [Nippostrongylus brasiliensis]|nr:hypothetical protein Q1695_015348 [Nippostrongylus brasiliensis]
MQLPQRPSLRSLLAHLNLDVINIYDILYSQIEGLTVAVTDYGPRPKLDDIERDAILTRSSARLSGEGLTDPLRGDGAFTEKKFGCPSLIADAIKCPHTHLINLEFRIENEEILWEVLRSYLKMYACLVHFMYSMELSKKDWESESKIFANRLNSTPHDLKLGDALLNSLLGGAPGPLAERWLERTVGASGIQSMREFVERRFSGLVTVLRGQLSAAARSLAFQMDQYRELVKQLHETTAYYESVMKPSSSSSGRQCEHPSTSTLRIADITANSAFEALDANSRRLILDQLHSGGIRIQAKCEEMAQAATSNLRELAQLVRWMSLLPPLLKNSKRPAQIMEQNSKWDVANLLKYIVQTFTADVDERKLLNLSLFNIDEILKELRAEETKEHYYDDEMMRTLVEERKLKRVDDERTLSELLSSIRKRPTSILDSPMCGPSDTSTPTRASSSHRQVHNEFVLDKVNAYWSEGLSPESQQVMGDRFGLEEVHDLANLKEKSLVDVVREVIEIVQGASLLVVQSDANVKLEWMYELASADSHCGFDSVRLSAFEWSDPNDMDVYEKKLFNAKGRDLEGAICVSTTSRDGLSCECLLPRASGKLRAGVQHDMSVAVALKPKGFLETTPVQSEVFSCSQTDQQIDGRLQLVTNENAVFGNITKFLSVDMYAGGHVYALATFKSEAGEMNKLMRKHPAMEAWFVHNGVTSEASEYAVLSTYRQQGCIVSEEGTRVALFRMRTSDTTEQPSSLLGDAPVHRPVLQLLSHHPR